MTQIISLQEFLQKIPKVDIHYHIMGGVSPQTLYELTKKYNLDLSFSEVEEYFSRDIKTSKGAVYALGLIYSLMREPADLQRIAFEIAESSFLNGVRYQELTWNPDEVPLPYDISTEALISGFSKAQEKHGIVTRLIPGINREKNPEIAAAMVTTVVANPYPEVIGIGIDYKEHDAPPEMFWKAFRIAKEAGLKLTAHCCEWEMHSRNVETALDLLECDRIDHGYMVLNNKELLQRCIDEGVLFTVVPSNSFYWKKFGGDTEKWRTSHPLIAMAKAGLKIVPATDDPELHLTNATNCYRTLIEDFGFNLDEIRQFILNGIDACWVCDKTKDEWREKWIFEYDDLRSMLSSEYN